MKLIKDAVQELGAQLVVANQQMKSGMVSDQDIRGVTYAEKLKFVRDYLAEHGVIPRTAARFLVHNDIMKAEKRWAEQNDVALVDVIQAMDERRDFLTSGVHLNRDGNAIVAGVLGDKIFRHMCGDEQSERMRVSN